MKTLKVYVSGSVQGVGYRYFVKGYADSLKISGYARNLGDGRVEVLMQGDDTAIEALINHIKQGSRYSSVTSIDCQQIENAPVQSGFVTG